MRHLVWMAVVGCAVGLSGCGQEADMSQSTGGEDATPEQIQNSMDMSRQMMMKQQQQQGKRVNVPEPKARVE